MKKIVSLVLAIFILFGVTGCIEVNKLKANLDKPKQKEKKKYKLAPSSVCVAAGYEWVSMWKYCSNDKVVTKSEYEKLLMKSKTMEKEAKEYKASWGNLNIRIINIWKEAGFTSANVREWRNIKNNSEATGIVILGGDNWQGEDSKQADYLKKWREVGFTAKETQYWIKRGEGDPIRAKNAKLRKDVMAKVEKEGISSITLSECTIIGAHMIEKKNAITCNYKKLEWSDLDLSGAKKREWRKAGFTPWDTKRWNDIGVTKVGYTKQWRDIETLLKARHLGYVKKIERFTQRHYDKWMVVSESTGMSAEEIKKWIAVGIGGWKGEENIKKLKDFGMTADTVHDYAIAGVNLGNLDDYEGMTLKEIQDEKALDDKRYAKIKKKEEEKEKEEIAKLRKNIKLIKPNKMYNCGFLKLKLGSSTLTVYDRFYGAVEDQLFYIDKTNTSKKYVGKKYTVTIKTNIKEVKKDLSNVKISEIGKFEMPYNCSL